MPLNAKSGDPEEAVPPLGRPQLAGARRMRAVELFEQRHSQAEVARMLGVPAESVRRWKRRMEQGGVAAPRRRPASGRPGRAHLYTEVDDEGRTHLKARESTTSTTLRTLPAKLSAI